jgi:hypothetical protein
LPRCPRCGCEVPALDRGGRGSPLRRSTTGCPVPPRSTTRGPGWDPGDSAQAGDSSTFPPAASTGPAGESASDQPPPAPSSMAKDPVYTISSTRPPRGDSPQPSRARSPRSPRSSSTNCLTDRSPGRSPTSPAPTTGTDTLNGPDRSAGHRHRRTRRRPVHPAAPGRRRLTMSGRRHRHPRNDPQFRAGCDGVDRR